MAEKHLLYFTAVRAVLYSWTHGRLAAEQSFPNSEDGAQAFSQHIAARKMGLFYVLADIVEEDFHQENIPRVRGSDRRALIERKLAQRYRDTTLTLALSLGTEKTQRRDERILFGSFTNTQQFQPWLAAVREREIAVGGVYSVALVASQLATRLGFRKTPVLLVTLEEAGLRQSYIEAGKLRFSRLGPLEASSVTDPDRVAEAFDRETTRVYQYLSAMRVVAPGASLDVVLLAPPGQRERIMAASPRVPQLRVTVVDFDAAAKAIGLRHPPAGAGAEALFLHLLAKQQPREQYAREDMRGAYRVWQLRKWMVMGGAAAFGACLLYAGLTFWKVHDLGDDIAADKQQAKVAVERYAQVTAKFPKMPTTIDNLRTTMQQYLSLVTQTRTPQPLLVDLSRALAVSPKIDVEQLKWETTLGLKVVVKAGDPSQQSVRVAAGGKAGESRYEVVEVSARVVAARSNDYRGITVLVDEFLDNLRKQPGVEIVATELPFDIGSQRALQGDVGVEQQSTEPRFRVTIARKVQT